ncbi:hypothetical protein M2103_002492 [Ereboglobus sp. PH5-5]|nr:hypothetical protein [Ereboglobus sp. PH5-10]MDF9834250.1 hypothetical protein [Ereboglobus sp. PH5-5]
MRTKNDRSHIPNGDESLSPGLARVASAYPGVYKKENTTLKGVASFENAPGTQAATPSGLFIMFIVPRVARYARNPGLGDGSPLGFI